VERRWVRQARAVAVTATVTASLLLSVPGVGASRATTKRPPAKPRLASAECRRAFKTDLAKKPAARRFATLPTTLTSCRSEADWTRAATSAGVLNVPQYLTPTTVLLFECATAKEQGGVCKPLDADLSAPLQSSPHASGAVLPCGEWWTAIAQFRSGQDQQALTTGYAAANDILQNVTALIVSVVPPAELVAAANGFESATTARWPDAIEQLSRTCVEFASTPSSPG
jgi:hypothetical protein